MTHDPNEWQGRRPAQIKDSNAFALIALTALAALVTIGLIYKMLKQ